MTKKTKTTCDINNNRKMYHSEDLKLKAKMNVGPTMTTSIRWLLVRALIFLVASQSVYHISQPGSRFSPQLLPFAVVAEASLIIGDSAIEIQELDGGQTPTTPQVADNQVQQQHDNGKEANLNAGDVVVGADQQLILEEAGKPEGQPSQAQGEDSSSSRSLMMSTGNNNKQQANSLRLPSGPLPPIGATEDITDGDKKSRGSHDYDMNELTNQQAAADRQKEMDQLSQVLSVEPDASSKFKYQDEGNADGKQITGKVVDFELTPAGGHNKAKIKKKKKMKKKKEGGEEAFKKWDKKKKMEKKAMEKKEKHHLKKKKEEGKKAKKKWGLQEQGQKKKGKFKKKK